VATYLHTKSRDNSTSVEEQALEAAKGKVDSKILASLSLERPTLSGWYSMQFINFSTDSLFLHRKYSTTM
jgi:hypothetical protein